MNQPCRHGYRIQPLPIKGDLDISRLFQHVADQPWSMLLDSANSTHPDSRFDVMVADPIVTVTVKDALCLVTGPQDKQVTYSGSDPLVILEALVEEYLPDQPVDPDDETELPFLIGAMGYFGYDLGRQFEILPQHAENDMQAPDLAVGLYTWSIIKDNRNGLWYLCHCTGYPHPGLEQIQAWANAPLSEVNDFSLQSDWAANMNREQYRAKIDQIHAYLKAGDCYQVNLAQRFSAQTSGDPWSAYLTLKHANQAPFSAFIRLEHACILSISPERFLAVRDRNIESKPIKGTRPRSSVPEVDQQQQSELLNSEKDQAENLMIVDLLRNDLSKNSQPGTVKVPALCQLESFAAVHHLVSTVTATLNDGVSPLKLLKGAFPGGSITGAPKIRAMEIIDELEPHRRNIYCGSIGYLGVRQDMDTSICIRTLLCEKDKVHCWAGGGIVLDSDADSEYQECLDKVAKILPVLSQGHE